MRLKNLPGLFLTVLFLAATPVAGAHAQTQPCAPIAQVFGKTICREDIAMEQNHITAIKQQYESQGLDSDEALKARSLERLRDTIWTIALNQKFGPERLAPSSRDVDLYGTAFKDTLRKNHEDNIEAARRIRTLLAGDSLSPEERTQLTALLPDLDTSISFYEQREQSQKDMPQEFHDMVAEAESGIAETMIREWKTDKALYEEYGGRLVVRQGRPEPADAYRRFLGYIEETGKLEILDPSFRTVFDSIKNEDVAPDETITDDSGAETYKDYFASPYWVHP